MKIKPKKYNSKFTYLILFLGCLLFSLQTFAAQHTITGNFPQLAGQTIRLTGFEGLQTYVIASATISNEGIFTLTYTERDYGMGYLSAADNKAFIIILEPNDIALEGQQLAIPESVRIVSGPQNQIFGRYASEHPRREQALSAWSYLEKMYRQDSLFLVHKDPEMAIIREKKRISAEDQQFLAQLNPREYVSWFLPARRLVSSVSTVAQYRTDEIEETIASFRKLDYADSRLYKSGLLKDAIEGHFWLIENSGKPLEEVFAAMKVSIDAIIPPLSRNEKRLNEVTNYLFDLLERHSLFDASEYLALKVLNEVSCTIDDNLAKQLETYRAMKKGNRARDFAFTGDVFLSGVPALPKPAGFYDIQSDYTLVVFGASWCPKCTEELPEIAGKYSQWKKSGVDVVFVSLDEDKTAFRTFAQNFPFISYCDYLKWKSPVAASYYVFATPTMFLLNRKKEIILRPTSVQQANAWVDWYLVKGNK
jgi:thiol-disulfide isomerase/thioredoxin